MASVARPNPTGALALGLVPGMGHFYTSRPLRGALTVTVAGAAIAAGYSYRSVTTVCLNDVPSGQACPAADVVREVTEHPYLWIGIGFAAAVTVVGAIDAYLVAKGQRDTFTAIDESSESVTLEIGLPSVTTYDDQLDFNFVRLRFR